MCFLTFNDQKRITILKYTGTRYVHKLNLTITKTTVNNKVIQALKAKSYLKKICFEKRFKGQNRIGIFNGNVNVISNVMLNYDAISGVCITNRPLHGHLEIQNFSFGLKDISWMSTMNKWNICISKWLCKIYPAPNNFCSDLWFYLPFATCTKYMYIHVFSCQK